MTVRNKASAFPPEPATTATLDALGNASGLRLMDLEEIVNLRRGASS